MLFKKNKTKRMVKTTAESHAWTKPNKIKYKDTIFEA